MKRVYLLGLLASLGMFAGCWSSTCSCDCYNPDGTLITRFEGTSCVQEGSAGDAIKAAQDACLSVCHGVGGIGLPDPNFSCTSPSRSFCNAADETGSSEVSLVPIPDANFGK